MRLILSRLPSPSPRSTLLCYTNRGGTRGGQGDFKWSDVQQDKDRENYLGHSVLAPVGRWQNGKDLTWYNKEGGPTTVEQQERERQREIRRIKEAEEDALAVALYVSLLRSFSASPTADPDSTFEQRIRPHPAPSARSNSPSSRFDFRGR